MADKDTPTAQSRARDLAKLTAELKKLNDEHKREGVERLSKSKNKEDRELAESWKRSLANDTSTMIESRSGSARRIGPDGRPIGPDLKKLNSGEYEVEGKKKGGIIRSSSRRADGLAQRGKTRGKFVR